MKYFAAVFAVFFSIAVTGCSSSTPDETIRALYEKTNKGDIQGAMALFNPQKMASDPAKKAATEDSLATVTARIAKKGGVTKVETTSTERGDVAEVKATTSFGDGQSETITARLLKVDGKWYINN